MFNKKKQLQKAFKLISKFIEKLDLTDQEKNNLQSLLNNIKIRTGGA